MGPTGAGKSAVAERLAEEFDARLVSADAFQVYRGLDIGTNKPEYGSKCALIDVVDPTEEFGLGQWVGLAQQELERCWELARNAIVVGGTGLYVRALFEEFADLRPPPDPDLRRLLEDREQREGLD